MKKIILSIFLLFFIINILNCSSGQQFREYDNIITKEIPVNNGKLSSQSIEKEKTFEITLKLKEPTDCIKIAIASKYYSDTLPQKEKTAKTYFIIERRIDLSQFRVRRKKKFYSEIAKNYNTQWKYKQYITVCSSENEPLKKLRKDSPYRIRFTTLSKKQCWFTIKIHSDVEIELIH